MNKPEVKDCNYIHEKKIIHREGFSGGIYGFGIIGALIYFLPQAHTFWYGVLAVVKAIFWPAFLVFKLFEFLKI